MIVLDEVLNFITTGDKTQFLRNLVEILLVGDIRIHQLHPIQAFTVKGTEIQKFEALTAGKLDIQHRIFNHFSPVPVKSRIFDRMIETGEIA